MTASKLKNAADVVLMLTELSNKGRAAARVGRPDSVTVQPSSDAVEVAYGDAKSDSDKAAAVQPKRRRGRPSKADIIKGPTGDFEVKYSVACMA